MSLTISTELMAMNQSDPVQVSLLTKSFSRELCCWAGQSALIISREGSEPQIYQWDHIESEEPFTTLKIVHGTLPLVRRRSIHGFKEPFYQSRLHLTQAHSQSLVRLVEEAMSDPPAVYQIYRSNGSTAIRDLLDQALGGALRRTFGSARATGSMRKIFHNHLSAYPFGLGPLEFILVDLIHGSRADLPVTPWEEMFFADRLQHYLTVAPSFTNDGMSLEGTQLLWGPGLAVGESMPAFVESYRTIQAILGVPLAIFLLGSLLLRQRRFRLRSIKWRMRIWGGLALVWGGLSSLMGLVIAYLWLCSKDSIYYANVNLWLFWPLDLIYILYGVHLIRFGHPTFRSTHLSPLVKWLSIAHLMICIVTLLVWSVDIFIQNVKLSMMVFAPIGLVFHFVTARQVISSGDRRYV